MGYVAVCTKDWWLVSRAQSVRSLNRGLMLPILGGGRSERGLSKPLSGPLEVSMSPVHTARLTVVCLCFAASSGCVPTDKDPDDSGSDPEDTGSEEIDNDNDGVLEADDCDDEDAELGAISEDVDCDGSLTADDCDDMDPSLNNADSDGDGYSTCEEDCDDTDEASFPGAAELDSETACMTDADGDGWGDFSPAKGVEAGTDCNDSEASAVPPTTMRTAMVPSQKTTAMTAIRTSIRERRTSQGTISIKTVMEPLPSTVKRPPPTAAISSGPKTSISALRPHPMWSVGPSRSQLGNHGSVQCLLPVRD